jgi:hypothetical protein
VAPLHTLLGHTLLGAFSSLLHGYFSYTWHYFSYIGECPHLFDLAFILFYLEVVMEDLS